MTKWLIRYRPVLLTVVGSVAVAVGITVSSGARAANWPAVHKDSKGASSHVATSSTLRWPLSIFSHRAAARAHRADVGKVSAPQGAILASVSDVGGVTNELYAWHKTPQEDCLVDIEGGSEITMACSPSSAAEAEGISWVGTGSTAAGTSNSVHVVAMVPDGVAEVQVTGVDGSTTGVDVTNNVAATSGADVKEFSYTMPDGDVISHRTESLRR